MKKVFAFLMVAFSIFALAACAPKDSDAAKAKMEKAGYSCAVAVNKEVADNGAVAVVTGTKEVEGNILSKIGGALDNAFTATLFDSAKNAKAAAQNSEGNVPEGTYVVGKWVFVGGEEAYKAFK